MSGELYFRYWRDRLCFVAELDLTDDRHEANVLVWSALDALAFAWTRAFHASESWATGNGANGRRFGEFLASFSNDFARVSLPQMWTLTQNEGQEKLLSRALSHWFEGFTSPNKNMIDQRAHRSVEDDPLRTEVSTAVASVQDREERESIEKLANRALWGRVGYGKMRNAVQHEWRAGEGTHGFPFDESKSRPTYATGRYVSPPVIGLSTELMIATLATCLDGFERLSKMKGIDPTPPAYE